MIDTHQHFWRLSRGGYAWMPDECAVLRRDYEPSDLAPLLAEFGITGTIAVQADDTVQETHFLLSLAADHSWICGVVGWVDLESSDAPKQIHDLARNPKFLGIRPMIQDIADPEWMLRPQLAPALAAVSELDLTFDALVRPHHLPELRKFVARYPRLRVVINHLAKPELIPDRFAKWADYMAELARSERVYCKLSGLLTEADTTAKIDQIESHLAHVVSLFGDERLVFGSDWPVLNLAGDYGAWIHRLEQFFAANPTLLRDQIGTISVQRAYPRLMIS